MLKCQGLRKGGTRPLGYISRKVLLLKPDLSLRVVEVCGDCDDGILHRLAQVGLCR